MAVLAVLVTDNILVASVVRIPLVNVTFPVTVVGLPKLTPPVVLAISRFLKVVPVLPPIVCAEPPLNFTVSVPVVYPPLFDQLPVKLKLLLFVVFDNVPELMVILLKL